jgi:hypothetical protein
MPIPFLDNPEYWLTRAKEARVVAEKTERHALKERHV